MAIPQMSPERSTGDAVEALCVDLAGRGEEIEAAGQLPGDVASQLRETGVFGLWLPAELGGAEAEPARVVDLVGRLAEADASVGWCAAIGLGSNLVGGYLPRAGAEEVFAAGTEVAGGSLMPSGRATRGADGSLLVTGRWPFASGAAHCDWLVGVAVVAGAVPDARLVILPRGDVELVPDTWQVAGLGGTGSVDFEVSGVAVPERRTASLRVWDAWPAGSMWRIPLHSLLLPVMGAVPLGIARAALGALTDLASTKTPFRSARTLRERDSTQAVVGRATAEVAAAAGYLRDALGRLFAAAAAGREPTLTERAEARAAAVHAAQSSADVVLACYRAAGSTALRRSSPLQRHLRDVNAATQHYALSHHGYETVGRVLLGLEPDVPL